MLSKRLLRNSKKRLLHHHHEHKFLLLFFSNFLEQIAILEHLNFFRKLYHFGQRFQKSNGGRLFYTIFKENLKKLKKMLKNFKFNPSYVR